MSGLKVSLLFGNGGAQKNKAAQNWTPFFLHLCFTELPSYEKRALCIRILALLLSRSPLAPRSAHTHTNNKKKNESDQVGEKRKKESLARSLGCWCADKTLGPHIVGLKSYLIGKQFKINNPAREPRSVNWRCEHQVD